jgi:hypothetical protein
MSHIDELRDVIHHLHGAKAGHVYSVSSGLMRQPRRSEQCNAKAPPSGFWSRAWSGSLVSTFSFLRKLAYEVRKDKG